MGGYLSTRWNWTPTRQETDPLFWLDIRRLKRWGALDPGAESYTTWTSRGEPSGDIMTRMSVDGRCLTLVYSVQKSGPDWQSVNDPVGLEWTPWHYGGERPWFRCPGCNSRRAVLYSKNARFRCRACHNLAYSSTREDPHERSIRRCGKLRQKLGGSFNQPIWTIPDKPAGMAWRRYHRLTDQLLMEIMGHSALLDDALLRLESRFGRRQGGR